MPDIAKNVGRPGRKAPRISWGPYLLLAPALVVLLVFTLWPMVKLGYASLFQIDTAHQQPVFVGLHNYVLFFQDPVGRLSLTNTLVFAVATVVPSVILALFFAVQLNKAIPARGALRAAIFYPTVLPLVSAATIWLFLYDSNNGIINKAMQMLHLPVQDWLGNPHTALGALVVMTIWKDAGYFMIFYLAGLQNMPGDVYEAADLDGASPWVAFWRITFPLLMPTTLFVTIIAAVASFKVVDPIFVMTAGGPNNATNMLLYHIYESQFSYSDTGMAATVSVVLLLILLAIAIFNYAYVDKRVHYD